MSILTNKDKQFFQDNEQPPNFKRVIRTTERQILSKEIHLQGKSLWDLLVDKQGRCRYCGERVSCTTLIKQTLSPGKRDTWICDCGFAILGIERRSKDGH